MRTERVFIQVSGGVVNDVYIPHITNGTYTVIDWDNYEADPVRTWSEFDKEDLAYIQEVCPLKFAEHYKEHTP